MYLLTVFVHVQVQALIAQILQINTDKKFIRSAKIRVHFGVSSNIISKDAQNQKDKIKIVAFGIVFEGKEGMPAAGSYIPSLCLRSDGSNPVPLLHIQFQNLTSLKNNSDDKSRLTALVLAGFSYDKLRGYHFFYRFDFAGHQGKDSIGGDFADVGISRGAVR